MLRGCLKSVLRCTQTNLETRKCLGKSPNPIQSLFAQSGSQMQTEPRSGVRALLAPNCDLKTRYGTDVREELLRKAMVIPEKVVPRFRNLPYVDRDVQDMTRSIYNYCVQHSKGAIKRPSIWHLYGPRGSGRTRFALELLPLLQKFASENGEKTDVEHNSVTNSGFESARLIYVNMHHGIASPNDRDQKYLDWSPEYRLALHLLAGYWFPFYSIDGLAGFLKEKQIVVPSLDSLLDLICSEPNPPKVLHIVFDDCDRYVDYSKNNFVKEFMKLLAAVQLKYTALTIVPMFITVRGPSLTQKYLQVSTCTVNHMEMKPMSAQTILDIVPCNPYESNPASIAPDSSSYLFLLDGNPGLAENVCHGFYKSRTVYGYLTIPICGWPRGFGVLAMAAMTGYPVDPRIHFWSFTFKDAFDQSQIFRRHSHTTFGRRQILSAPIVAMMHCEMFSDDDRQNNLFNEIFELIKHRGPRWFEKICFNQLALRFSLAHSISKNKMDIEFIDLFGDAHASAEMKKEFKVRSIKKLLPQELASSAELDLLLKTPKHYPELVMLPNGQENTAVLSCYRAEDLRPCWIWIRVVKKNKNDPFLNPNEVRPTTHPSIPHNDQFTLVVSNGQAFADLVNVIGTRTVVICDDNLSTSFSAVLAPLIRNLEQWEQLKDSKV